MEKLLERFEGGEGCVGVIGLGYVGLPLAIVFHGGGLDVLGFDVDEDKVDSVNTGKSYIRHIANETVEGMNRSGRFRATSKFEDLEKVDAYVMCLPTPLGPHEEPDMSYVFDATKRIASQLKRSQLVVLESTTYPGTTDQEICEILTSGSGLAVGKEVFVAYSPERENPGGTGDEELETASIPKLVGGVDSNSTLLAAALYRCGGFRSVIEVKSSRVAECAKLLENIFRVVNIALVNELKLIFEKLDVDIWDVLDAAETKPFGFKRFNPGPGVGGHCIPIDPFYLTWKAKEVGQRCEFIEISGLVNAAMPRHVVRKVQSALNDDGKAVKGSKVLLLGVAYKKNVDDLREAPSLQIWEELLDLKAEVTYFDPFLPRIPKTRQHPRLQDHHSVDFTAEVIAACDAVVLITDHDQVDYSLLERCKGSVIDTRNRLPRNANIRVVPA